MTLHTRLTLEESLALPDTEPASEYACGEVMQQPMPDSPHAALQTFFRFIIRLFLQELPLGRVGGRPAHRGHREASTAPPNASSWPWPR